MGSRGESGDALIAPHRDIPQGHRNRRGLDAPRTRRPACRTRLLDKKVPKRLISKCIRENHLTPNRPTLKRLTDEVHAKCATAGFSLPDRRTICARVLAIPERTRALRRADTAGALTKLTTPTPGKLVLTRPPRGQQIDHTEVDVVVVDEEKRQPLPGRPWLTQPPTWLLPALTGFHLSMSEPSRLVDGALGMLRATFDKTRVAHRITDVTEEWPTVGLPEMIGVDNGSDFTESADFSGPALREKRGHSESSFDRQAARTMARPHSK